MALNAVRRIGKIAAYLPNSRTILSSSSKSFRIGENTSNARTITRSLFFLSRNRDSSIGSDHLGASVSSPWSNTCSCGCSVHTKGDKELAAFLQEEIENESKLRKPQALEKLEGFSCTYDGAEVTLSKQFNNEIITIKTNVNHSVDAEENDVDPSEAKENEPEMTAKPNFTVEVAKGSKVLSFECCFSEVPPQDEREGPYNDSFEIVQLSMHDGESSDSTYTVDGDIMDGYLYDLLMNYLEERGVSSDFADKLIILFTNYEHKLYIGLLQGMKKFIEK